MHDPLWTLHCLREEGVSSPRDGLCSRVTPWVEGHIFLTLSLLLFPLCVFLSPPSVLLGTQ